MKRNSKLILLAIILGGISAVALASLVIKLALASIEEVVKPLPDPIIVKVNPELEDKRDLRVLEMEWSINSAPGDFKEGFVQMWFMNDRRHQLYIWSDDLTKFFAQNNKITNYIPVTFRLFYDENGAISHFEEVDIAGKTDFNYEMSIYLDPKDGSTPFDINAKY